MAINPIVYRDLCFQIDYLRFRFYSNNNVVSNTCVRTYIHAHTCIHTYTGTYTFNYV